MSMRQSPDLQAFLEEQLKGPLLKLLEKIEEDPSLFKDLPLDQQEILKLLGTHESGGSDEEMEKIFDYIRRNWIDPESLSVDEGTMTQFGGETAYTVAGESYSGDPRRKVDWAGGIPTEDKAATILDAMKMKLSDNPAYSDTTTTEEYEGLMNELKAPGLLEKFMNLFK